MAWVECYENVYILSYGRLHIIVGCHRAGDRVAADDTVGFQLGDQDWGARNVYGEGWYEDRGGAYAGGEPSPPPPSGRSSRRRCPSRGAARSRDAATRGRSRSEASTAFDPTRLQRCRRTRRPVRRSRDPRRAGPLPRRMQIDPLRAASRPPVMVCSTTVQEDGPQGSRGRSTDPRPDAAIFSDRMNAECCDF